MNFWERELNLTSAIATPATEPSNTPVSPWDTWDYRALWNVAIVATEQFPPDAFPPTKYLYPHGQVFP
jgi:hypothetical protein